MHSRCDHKLWYFFLLSQRHFVTASINSLVLEIGKHKNNPKLEVFGYLVCPNLKDISFILSVLSVLFLSRECLPDTEWRHSRAPTFWTTKQAKLLIFLSLNIDDLFWCQLTHFLLLASWLWSLLSLPVVFSRCNLPGATIRVILSLSCTATLPCLPIMSRLEEGWCCGYLLFDIEDKVALNTSFFIFQEASSLLVGT